MSGNKRSGNRTKRRGRKLTRIIHLDRETAQVLRILTMVARMASPGLTEEQYVTNLIDQAWCSYDHDLMAVEPWEGGVL